MDPRFVRDSDGFRLADVKVDADLSVVADVKVDADLWVDTDLKDGVIGASDGSMADFKDDVDLIEEVDGAFSGLRSIVDTKDDADLELEDFR